MNQAKSSFPKLFKGIALFTPGGDLIYCVDPSKQSRWHINLCTGIQEILDLPEPPHFLIPCYTATIDRWLDPRTQQVQTFAEAYPLVLRHQTLLNAVFETGELVWQAAPWTEGLCDPVVLATYHSLFPQLWEDHDLIVRFDQRFKLGLRLTQPALSEQQSLASSRRQKPETPGYVLRLFIAGHSVATERILQTLYQLLEQSLPHPYTLKVIDVSRHPEQAEADQVSATPTLVKVWPQPIRRLVGELDNVEKLLQMLVSPNP